MGTSEPAITDFKNIPIAVNLPALSSLQEVAIKFICTLTRNELRVYKVYKKGLRSRSATASLLYTYSKRTKHSVLPLGLYTY